MIVIRGFIITMLLVAAVYVLSFAIFVATRPRVPTPVPHADGIVALTGGDTRLEAAANLLQQGFAKRVLVSGVDQEISRGTLKKLMHAGDKFDCCVDLGYSARDTQDNAQEAADWAHDHKFKSLLLVTGRYHMPRAKVEFQDRMPQVKLTAYPVEESGIEIGDWWHHRATTLLLNREYVKYLAALVRTAVT
jgi:uncharacterized SAM-binding protein YcdF (DUF218 family)